MNEKTIVEDLLYWANYTDRLYCLTTVLYNMGFRFTMESCAMTENMKCTNVILDYSKPGEKYTLFVAHHDLWGESTGINDNTTAIASILAMLHEHKDKKFSKSFKVLFCDKEETGMVGSNSYGMKYKNEIEEVIVLDIVGYGDHLTWASSNDRFEYLNDHGVLRINTILPSDNLTFERNGIPNTLIVAAHDEDLTKAGENNYNLASDPKFYESFHCRAMDGDMDIINWPLVGKLRNILYELIK